MATRIRLTPLEDRIFRRMLSEQYESAEHMLVALGVDRNLFVDALEALESAGLIAVATFAGTIIVATDNWALDIAALAAGGNQKALTAPVNC